LFLNTECHAIHHLSFLIVTWTDRIRRFPQASSNSDMKTTRRIYPNSDGYGCSGRWGPTRILLKL
jgi:hypothetical protein